MTASDIRVLTVIPVYNHADTLAGVARQALAEGGEVLVVDDGSSEDVAGALSGLPVRMVSHRWNRGKGAAIMTAAAEARRLGMTHIITIDADGQHDPADRDRFYDEIEKHPTAVIVGRRDFEASTAPGHSRFGRGFSNFWFRVQTGRQAWDAQSGFRAYPVEVLDKLDLHEKGFAFEVEVLVRASWAGVEVRRVDVSVHYPPPGERISHFRLLADNLRLTHLNARLTMRSVVPLPHRQILAEEAAAEKLSIRRPLQAMRALLAENCSPADLAAAGALGVFIGTLPILGLHTVLILLTAGYFRLNRVAALSASQLCMPPFVPALGVETGYLIRHGRFLTDISLQTLGYEALERVYEWVIGSTVLALPLALIVGAVVYLAASLVKRQLPVTES